MPPLHACLLHQCPHMLHCILLRDAGIILYTSVGGLKATFTSSYIHTIIVYVVLCLFCFKVYVTSDQLGSPAEVYRRLQVVCTKISSCASMVAH